MSDLLHLRKEEFNGRKSVPAKVAKTEANKGEEKPKPESRADPPTEFISVRAAPPPENMLQGFKALAEVLLRTPKVWLAQRLKMPKMQTQNGLHNANQGK